MYEKITHKFCNNIFWGIILIYYYKYFTLVCWWHKLGAVATALCKKERKANIFTKCSKICLKAVILSVIRNVIYFILKFHYRLYTVKD